MTLSVLAFLAGSLLTALWFAHRDDRRDADLHDLDAYRKAREALAPVVQPAPRRRGQSSREFLFGLAGTNFPGEGRPAARSPHKVDRLTPAAGSGLAAAGEFEQTASMTHRVSGGSKHRAAPQRGLSALPRTTGRGRAGLLHRGGPHG